MEWDIPKTFTNLRGFLRLIWNYCKFIKNYKRIVAPLTTLLNKDAFSWTLEAIQVFEKLKEAMCRALVLATPDFTNTFIVESDVSGNGTGAILMQEGSPPSFESWSIKGKNLHNPIFKKEMFAIIHALKWWRNYIIGRNFKVKKIMIVLNTSWKRDYP